MKFRLFTLLMGMLLSEGMAQNAVKMELPLREVSIIATKDGFFPNAISVHQGERVRFFLTSTHDTPECFVLKNPQIFIAAEKGKISEKEVVFQEVGRFKFFCPSSKSSGHITVIEKNAPEEIKENQKNRDLAGDYDDGVPDVWTPKDY